MKNILRKTKTEKPTVSSQRDQKYPLHFKKTMQKLFKQLKPWKIGVAGINSLLYNTSKAHFSKKSSSIIRNKHNIWFLKTMLTLTEHSPHYIGMKVKKCFIERTTIFRSLKTAKLDKK